MEKLALTCSILYKQDLLDKKHQLIKKQIEIDKYKPVNIIVKNVEARKNIINEIILFILNIDYKKSDIDIFNSMKHKLSLLLNTNKFNQKLDRLLDDISKSLKIQIKPLSTTESAYIAGLIMAEFTFTYTESK